jgi:hypothetical protein
MPHYLLTGAGFTQNWGGMLASEVTGSLLADLQDFPDVIAKLSEDLPFEYAFQGFTQTAKKSEAQRQFENAVVSVFHRMNLALLKTRFEFRDPPVVGTRVKDFLSEFDAIFTLNQDQLLELHYMRNLLGVGKLRWSEIVIPGMKPIAHDMPHFEALNLTWEPTGGFELPRNMQPYVKLHGSTNWSAGPGKPIMVMGYQKADAIIAHPVLQRSHEYFAQCLNQPDAKLMTIGYGFQDDHINDVIAQASVNGMRTFIVDLAGRGVLEDRSPRMKDAITKPVRWIKRDIKLAGDLRQPLSVIFRGDGFGHGELMRFFR